MTATEPAAASRPGLPSRFGFIIAGVQKAGTTSLYAMLSKHRQVAPARKKELHFFDDDKINWEDPPYNRYHAKITKRRSATIAGEASPRYVFWPGSMERIHAYDPNILIILSFRDPIERAFSHWGMSSGLRGWRHDFTETIRKGWSSGWPRSREAYRKNPAQTILARGYYGAQLEHTFSIFDREQVLLLDYHRLFRELDSSLRLTTDFLGIRPFGKTPESHANTAPPNLVGKAPTADDVSRLAELYADDQAKFASVSGIDVSGWSTSRILDGSLSAADLAERLAAKVRLRVPTKDAGADGDGDPGEPVAEIPPERLRRQKKRKHRRPEPAATTAASGTADPETPNSEASDSDAPASEVSESEAPAFETSDSGAPDSDASESEAAASETSDSTSPDSDASESAASDSGSPDADATAAR